MFVILRLAFVFDIFTITLGPPLRFTSGRLVADGIFLHTIFPCPMIQRIHIYVGSLYDERNLPYPWPITHFG